MTPELPDAPPTNDQTDAARDDRLAAILAALTDELRRGGRPEIDEAARRHPELADELRELWGAVLIAEEMAQRAGSRTGGEAATLAMPGRSARQRDESAPATPLPRTFGDYELLAELGRGGMGVVYKARQKRPDRLVALKMILRGELATSSDQARFREEAEAAAQLDHPGIVTVYDVAEHAGQPYFAMQLIEGTTLARRLTEGPLNPREAARLLADVCHAIHYAHNRGVLHRDLKPSNILIDHDGRPHVTDFGLAKRADVETGLTRTGQIVGTPRYMAPEQASGRRAEFGPTGDVYSLGTILYQMLTGQPPFQAESEYEIIRMVIERDPPPPRLLNPRVDRDLEFVALKCLQKPPALRYQSAGELAEDLEAYLRGDPVSARSGAITQVVAHLFRETHHATVLENWGLLWMWHSLALLVTCLLTNALQLLDFRDNWRWLYAALWTVGLGTWAAIFWMLRRRAGPVMFVERQIAHVWAGSMAGIALLYLVEWQLKLPVLTLSPVLALMNGASMLVKAGTLSGTFYFQAAALFVTALLMARFPTVGISLFGIVSALSFFLPGLKYYRQRRRSEPGVP